MSNTTRRHPRTLQEAFGPYATGPVLDKPEPRRRPLADVLLAVALGIVGALLLARWFAA